MSYLSREALLTVLFGALVLNAGCASDSADDTEPSGEEAAELAGDSFKVMTYNLRYQQSVDTGPRRWSRRFSSLIARVRANDPDIFAVQEAKRPSGDIDYPAAMKKELSDNNAAYDVLDPRGGSPKLIFFRRARFELAEAASQANDFALPNTANESAPCTSDAVGKKAVWVKLRDKRTGKVVFFINTHLVAGNCPRTREDSAVAIKQLVNAKSGGLPVVIVGDMNNDPQASDAVNEDTVHVFKGRGRDLKSAINFTGTTTDADATFNSSWDSAKKDTHRIDYVFYSAGLKPLSNRIDRTTNADGISPSDHYPVIVTFAM